MQRQTWRWYPPSQKWRRCSLWAAPLYQCSARQPAASTSAASPASSCWGCYAACDTTPTSNTPPSSIPACTDSSLLWINLRIIIQCRQKPEAWDMVISCNCDSVGVWVCLSVCPHSKRKWLKLYSQHQSWYRCNQSQIGRQKVKCQRHMVMK